MVQHLQAHTHTHTLQLSTEMSFFPFFLSICTHIHAGSRHSPIVGKIVSVASPFGSALQLQKSTVDDDDDDI